MKVKPQGKTSVSDVNHDETLVRLPKPTPGLKVKTGVRGGKIITIRTEGQPC
jgi:hypothetical protein